MSQLLALSFDCPSSPSLSIESDTHVIKNENLQGWGLGWYPNDDYAATIIKDSKNQNRVQVAKSLKSWKRFNSTLFIFHLRGAAKRAAQQDTQPFSRSFAGHDWIICHNGDLQSDYKKYLSLGKNPVFEPMGLTDSEHAFCWLLNIFFRIKARRLADFDKKELYKILHKINQLGTANIMLTDNQDLVIYNDHNNFHPIYWARKHPPYNSNIFKSPSTKIEIDDIESQFRTFIIASTYENFIDGAHKMNPGQMLVVRRGNLVWNSNDYDIPLEHLKAQETGFKPYKFISSSQSSKTIHEFANTKTIVRIQKSISDNLRDTEFNILTVNHNTKYIYKKPVYLSKHDFRLHPVDDYFQKVIDYHLKLSTINLSENFQDVFGNEVSMVKINKAFDKLEVSMSAKVICYDLDISRFSHLTNRRTLPLLWLP